MRCPHHPQCPGCPLADLPYPAQLDAKRDRLADAMRMYPHLPRPPAVQPATRQIAYRHRVKLPVAVEHGRARVGLYDRATRAVLHTPDCPVLTPDLNATLTAMTPWLSSHPEVHSVDLRTSAATGAQQLVLAVDGASLRGGGRALDALTRACPPVRSIAVSTADPERKRVMGRRPQVAAGPEHVEEQIGDARYRLYPGAFFQVDPDNARALHALVHRAVGDARTVLDLYAGVGAYALSLAPGRDRVVAVEEVPQAAAAAAAMAPPNVEVVTARVEAWIGSLPPSASFDVAILNPARRGSLPHALAAVARIARRLIYVSCGPETLARDLDCLAAHGMRVTTVQPIDLFPQTAEVETVVTLERGPALRAWGVDGGRAAGPWLGHASGALGRPREAVALVIGDPGPRGALPGGRFERLGIVATHGLLHLTLDGPLDAALRGLARRGHPTAGRDPRTASF
ncbi:MAG TPA: hypothetical protein PKA64_04395, partial [Myxococcota bacterium]|nr:hypothetical protein [Myxococcota bacterium]